MLVRPYESRLRPLIERLETAQVEVEAEARRREDAALLRALLDGSYGPGELDRLFERIEKPFLDWVTYAVAYMRRHPGLADPSIDGDDPFHRGLILLCEWMLRSSGADSESLDELMNELEDKATGQHGAAHIGLLRRLISSRGLERFWAGVVRLVDEPSEFRLPQINSDEECTSLMRLVAPIERDHLLPILWFECPTGSVRSTYPNLHEDFYAQ